MDKYSIKLIFTVLSVLLPFLIYEVYFIGLFAIGYSYDDKVVLDFFVFIISFLVLSPAILIVRLSKIDKLVYVYVLVFLGTYYFDMHQKFSAKMLENPENPWSYIDTLMKLITNETYPFYFLIFAVIAVLIIVKVMTKLRKQR